MKHTGQLLAALLCMLLVHSCTFYNPLTHARKYKLPYGMVTANQMCGDPKKCVAGTTGVDFHFRNRPYSPDLTDVTNARQIAYSILGHAVLTDDNSGQFPLTCSNVGDNPFTDADIAPLGNLGGRKWQLAKSETLKLDVTAAVDATMAQLVGVSDPALLANAKAQITAAYNRLNNSNLSIDATYMEWGLTNNALDKLTRNLDHCECKSFMFDSHYSIITAIGLVTFTVNYQAQTLDVIAAELQASLEQQGITANVTAQFKREVSSKLNADLKNGYQIPVWTLADVATLSVGHIASKCAPDPLAQCRWVAPTDRTIPPISPHQPGINIFTMDCLRPELAGQRIVGELDMVIHSREDASGHYGYLIRLFQPDGSAESFTESASGEKRIHHITDPFTVPADGKIHFNFLVDHAWGANDPQPLIVRAGSTFFLRKEGDRSAY